MKRIAIIVLAALALAACTKPNELDNNTPGTPPGTTPGEQIGAQKDCDIHGYAQKGQFVKGSQVTAFAVGQDLVATGESFPSNISDDLGAFGITGKTKAPFLELRAEGYYFNELTGAISQNPLYLEAFVKSDDKKANINLLTTAVRPRVKKLIKEGKSYDEAVSQAQNELLTAVGFTGNAADFDEMDITGTSDADGMLLAFACMVQSDRSASEVTTFVQEIASDIEDDGKMSSAVFDKYKAKLDKVNPFEVIVNLANYYSEKKLSVSSVPDFYRYLDARYNVDFIYDFDPALLRHDADGVIGGAINVLSSVNFTVESDIEGAVVEKRQILGPAYNISFEIPANKGFEDRDAHIIFKDASGKELASQAFSQKGDVQYLIILGDLPTKSTDGSYTNPIREGAVVSVNGTECTLTKYDALNGELGVAVYKAPYYSISYPANAISVNGEGGLDVNVKIETPRSSGYSVQYYGFYRSGSSSSQYPEVRMWPAMSLLKIKLDESILYESSYLEMTPNADGEYLAGTARYRLSDSFTYNGFQDQYLSFEAGDASRTIKINCVESSDEIVFPVFSQTVSQGFTVALFDKSGKMIVEKTNDTGRTIYPGALYSLGTLYAPSSGGNPAWLELPAYQEDNSHKALIHDMQGGKYVSRTVSGVRNWTGYWNASEHLCDWVAYPLNSSLRGSGSRTDEWGLDPLLPAGEQPNLTTGSYGGGWTRGHQIPSADRLNYTANVSTFFATNMTPQEYNFNGDIWADLENQVRSYSYQSDTLYVVTGCLVENSTTYSGNRSGFIVRVPTHYYKALLSRKGSTYKAIGYYMPHSSSIAGGAYSDYAVSIDELEQLTGIDFFPNLKMIIGGDAADAIEATTSGW